MTYFTSIEDKSEAELSIFQLSAFEHSLLMAMNFFGLTVKNPNVTRSYYEQTSMPASLTSLIFFTCTQPAMLVLQFFASSGLNVKSVNFFQFVWKLCLETRSDVFANILRGFIRVSLHCLGSIYCIENKPIVYSIDDNLI